MGSTAEDKPTMDPEDPIYAQLRSIAERQLRRERPDHTLQATALVHEAYLRMADNDRLRSLDSTECLYLATRVMRSVLVDHARRRTALKRGGGARREPLDQAVAVYAERALDLEALENALSHLEQVHPELAKLVELRFFGGLPEAAIAEVMQVSVRTVRRGWKLARSWLYQEIRSMEIDGT